MLIGDLIGDSDNNGTVRHPWLRTGRSACVLVRVCACLCVLMCACVCVCVLVVVVIIHVTYLINNANWLNLISK